MRRSILAICSGAALAVGVYGAGCERQQGDGLPVPPTGVVHSDRTSELPPPTSDLGRGHEAHRSDATQGTLDDAALVAELRDKLSASERAEGRAISVRASDGVVTLTGRVSSPAAKETAEEIAHDVGGVERVENRIVVAQLSAATDSPM